MSVCSGCEGKSWGGFQSQLNIDGLKPVFNWANVCSPEHTLDTLANYDLFLN